MIEERLRECDVTLQSHDERDTAGTDPEHAPNYPEDAKIVHVGVDDLLRQVPMQVHLNEHARQSN